MRRTILNSGSRRRGVAAVEFAVVLPLLLLMLVGIWELGRIIHVQIILNTAARDGARLAAQSSVVSPNGAYTQIHFNTGTPSIEGAIRANLMAAGITDLTNLVVELEFVESAPGGATPGSTTADPYTGAKNQRFRVRVSIPYEDVRWTTLSLVNPNTLTAEVYWQCLIDDPFTVNTTLPGWSP